MTPKTFKAELVGLINRAKEDIKLQEIDDILTEEMHSVAGDLWLHQHYKGDVPPRLKSPPLRTKWPVDRIDNQCSEMSNACEQDEGHRPGEFNK